MIENHQHITKDTRRKERRREEDHLLDDLDEMSSAFPTAIRDVSNIACERIQQSGEERRRRPRLERDMASRGRAHPADDVGSLTVAEEGRGQIDPLRKLLMQSKPQGDDERIESFLPG
jgi:hypothetical protein